MSGRTKPSCSSFWPASSRSSSTRRARLAERIRAGGAGIPAFFTKTGYGTKIAEGKDTRDFDGERYVMERGLVADLSIVHAYRGDTEGNLVYRKTARNFNPPMATAGKVTVAEVEHLVQPGDINPDHIVTPGIYVKRMIHVPAATKHIEQRTVRKRQRPTRRPEPGRKSMETNALDPRSDGRTRRQRAARRLLRQSRHRHSDAGVELHSGRHERAAAIGERHARHRPVPVRGRGRSRSDQCRQADRHRAADHELFQFGRTLSP